MTVSRDYAFTLLSTTDMSLATSFSQGQTVQPLSSIYCLVQIPKKNRPQAKTNTKPIRLSYPSLHSRLRRFPRRSQPVAAAATNEFPLSPRYAAGGFGAAPQIKSEQPTETRRRRRRRRKAVERNGCRSGHAQKKPTPILMPGYLNDRTPKYSNHNQTRIEFRSWECPLGQPWPVGLLPQRRGFVVRTPSGAFPRLFARCTRPIAESSCASLRP